MWQRTWGRRRPPRRRRRRPRPPRSVAPPSPRRGRCSWGPLPYPRNRRGGASSPTRRRPDGARDVGPNPRSPGDALGEALAGVVPELSERPRAERLLRCPPARAEAVVELFLLHGKRGPVDLAALRRGIDAVKLRGVEAEDLPLHLVGDLRVPVHVLELLGDRERSEGHDLALRASAEDAVGPPDDVVRAEIL